MRRISSLCLSALLIMGASSLISASANAATASIGFGSSPRSGNTVSYFNEVTLSDSPSNWDYAELVVTNPDGSTQSSMIISPPNAVGPGTFRVYSDLSIGNGVGTYGITAYDAGYKSPDAQGNYRWSASAHWDVIYGNP